MYAVVMAPLRVICNCDGSAVCGIMVTGLPRFSLEAKFVAQHPWIIMAMVYGIMMAPRRAVMTSFAEL